ncbi:hypothetical protein ACFLTS_06290, partial [Chloroflexota bacterium]
MRNRVFVSLLGIAILALTLGCLLGIIDILSEDVAAGPVAVSPSTQLPTTGLVPTATQGPEQTTKPQETKTPDSTPQKTEPPEADSTPPDSEVSDIGDTISSDISPEGGLPPHIPIFEVTGAANTSLLRTTATSNYDGKVWQPEDNAKHYVYKGETLELPVEVPSQQTIDDIEVVPLIEFPAGTVPVPTSLYPSFVSSKTSLIYFP